MSVLLLINIAFHWGKGIG